MRTGVSALTSDAEGKHHNQCRQFPKSSTLSFKDQNDSAILPTSSSATAIAAPHIQLDATQTPALPTHTQFCLFRDRADRIVKAEILWCLRLEMQHQSFNSCKDINDKFRLMFSDSDIAQTFTLGKDKAAYIVSHGLAPFFKSSLMKELKNPAVKFTVCFDEAFNKIVHKGQLAHLIFFDKESEYDCYALYGVRSCFLYWSPVKHVKSEANPNAPKKLLDIGTCGLHVVHGASGMGRRQPIGLSNSFQGFSCQKVRLPCMAQAICLSQMGLNETCIYKHPKRVSFSVLKIDFATEKSMHQHLAFLEFAKYVLMMLEPFLKTFQAGCISLPPPNGANDGMDYTIRQPSSMQPRRRQKF